MSMKGHTQEKDETVHKTEVVPVPQNKVKRQREAPLTPLPEKTLREAVLKAAGVTTEELGRLARKGITKAEKLLEAEETRFFQYQGVVCSKRTVKSLDTQLRAAKELIELTGVKPSRAVDGGKDTGGVVIHVHLPWSGKEDKPEVIEAQGETAS